MAIAAKRFKTLDKQTNVPIADFLNPGNSDILNSPELELGELDKNMQEFIKNNLPTVPETPSLLNDAVREAKGAMGAIRNLGGLSTKDIDKAIEDIIPNNPQAKAAFGQLSSKCKNSALKNGGLGKPYDPSINCNGKNRKGSSSSCNSGQYGDILNKLTGGAYSSTFNDLNKTLKALISLASYGYKMNMCGVFTALSGNTDVNVLSRASGFLLSSLSADKNTLGIVDLANSSAGLHTLMEYPAGIKDAFNNFKMPEEIKQADMSSFADRYTGAMEMFNENWNKNPDTAQITVGFADKFNHQASDLLSANTLSRSISEDALQMAPGNDADFLCAAYKSIETPVDWSGLI